MTREEIDELEDEFIEKFKRWKRACDTDKAIGRATKNRLDKAKTMYRELRQLAIKIIEEAERAGFGIDPESHIKKMADSSDAFEEPQS